MGRPTLSLEGYGCACLSPEDQRIKAKETSRIALGALSVLDGHTWVDSRLIPRPTKSDLQTQFTCCPLRPFPLPHADFVHLPNSTPTEIWHERTLRLGGRVGWLRGWRDV